MPGNSSLSGNPLHSVRTRFLDYIGLDYYDPFACRAGCRSSGIMSSRTGRSAPGCFATVTSKWWDWRVLPRGLAIFSASTMRKNSGRPVLIAENGMALRHRVDGHEAVAAAGRTRMTCSRFLRLHCMRSPGSWPTECRLLSATCTGRCSITTNGAPIPAFWTLLPRLCAWADRLAEDPAGDRPSETYASLIPGGAGHEQLSIPMRLCRRVVSRIRD